MSQASKDTASEIEWREAMIELNNKGAWSEVGYLLSQQKKNAKAPVCYHPSLWTKIKRLFNV